MTHDRRRPYRTIGAAVAAIALLVLAAQAHGALAPGSGGAGSAPAAKPPPKHAGFDYQIGGPYAPPSGVEVVSRDHTAKPADGLYNICYVNAFQAQPDAEDEWGDLLLRDANGDVVYDKEWDEAFLDLRTADKRERIAKKVGRWIDSCAEKGFQAVEPDNYDSYTRAPDKLLTAKQAQAFIKLLSERAHDKGLAIGQKNTPDLADARKANGLDFAVAEECGEYDECGRYAKAFDDRVVVIEYTRDGLAKACEGWGDRLSVVRRDVDVSKPGDDGYVRQTC
ncbi:endo alpha-1,4 polygalactosaminidase [Streptomyces albiaxialis]|uniref:Endo alpha-1,4 polygalactosaminidase n=1 Tax=Streptomyces albiaxialis TaxID=329523 RepID=A0ABP5I9L6_9ACTN